MSSTIRRRLVRTFAAFAALLSCLFSVFVLLVYHRVEDRFYRRQLERLTDEYPSREEPNRGVASRWPATPLVFGRSDELPDAVAERVVDLLPGHHEIELDDAELHILVRRSPSTSETLYAVASFEESESAETRFRIGVGVAIVATTVVGSLLGGWLARRVVSPVERLTERLRRGVAFDGQLAVGLDDGEILSLAKTLDDSMRRVRSTLERERRFIQERVTTCARRSR